jgi:hypothetical protein
MEPLLSRSSSGMNFTIMDKHTCPVYARCILTVSFPSKRTGINKFISNYTMNQSGEGVGGCHLEEKYEKGGGK